MAYNILAFGVLGLSLGLGIKLNIVPYQNFKRIVLSAILYVVRCFMCKKSNDIVSAEKKSDYDEVIEVSDLQDKLPNDQYIENYFANYEDCLFYSLERKDKIVLAFDVLEQIELHSFLDASAAMLEIQNEFISIRSKLSFDFYESVHKRNEYFDQPRENRSELFESVYSIDAKEKHQKLKQCTNVLVNFVIKVDILVSDFKVAYRSAPENPLDKENYTNELSKIRELVLCMKKALAEYYGVKIPSRLLVDRPENSQLIFYKNRNLTGASFVGDVSIDSQANRIKLSL